MRRTGDMHRSKCGVKIMSHVFLLIQQVIARRGNMPPGRSQRIYVHAQTDPQSAQLWWPGQGTTNTEEALYALSYMYSTSDMWYCLKSQ